MFLIRGEESSEITKIKKNKNAKAYVTIKVKESSPFEIITKGEYFKFLTSN